MVVVAMVAALAPTIQATESGALIMVAIPLVMAALRSGSRGLAWGWVGGVVTVIAASAPPAMAWRPADQGTVLDFAALTLVVGWLLWNAGLAVHAVRTRVRLARIGLGDGGVHGSATAMFDAAGVLVSAAALPMVAEGSLLTVAAYVAFVTWNHDRLVVQATVLDLLAGARAAGLRRGDRPGTEGSR